jgi:hypothetical protein
VEQIGQEDSSPEAPLAGAVAVDRVNDVVARAERDLAMVEESLRLLDDPDADPDAAVAWVER